MRSWRDTEFLGCIYRISKFKTYTSSSRKFLQCSQYHYHHFPITFKSPSHSCKCSLPGSFLMLDNLFSSLPVLSSAAMSSLGVSVGEPCLFRRPVGQGPKGRCPSNLEARYVCQDLSVLPTPLAYLCSWVSNYRKTRLCLGGFLGSSQSEFGVQSRRQHNHSVMLYQMSCFYWPRPDSSLARKASSYLSHRSNPTPLLLGA